MFNPRPFPAIWRGARIAACAALAATSVLTGAVADPPQQPPHRPSHAVTKRVQKCICGYGVSGYDALTCTPVKDCEWERGVCRGKC